MLLKRVGRCSKRAIAEAEQQLEHRRSTRYRRSEMRHVFQNAGSVQEVDVVVEPDETAQMPADSADSAATNR